MKQFLIAPSILSANFACLGEDIKQVLSAGADIIHFDVMDNHYVPNLTIGPMVLKSLRKYNITAPVDVHLMTKPVESLIPKFAKAGANFITVHPESTNNLSITLQNIRDCGCKSGVVLNPNTSINCLDYILDKLDLIVLMSVNPGFGGQCFISSTFDKLKYVKKKIQNSSYKILLEVDGGIKLHNIADIALAGADILVVGSAIFNSLDYISVITSIRKKLDKVSKIINYI
ncbi:ribulose-phosphate 3-epimerase [Buchnera aphidicola (Mollitrichosiphum nigrofasciatum)]|uniref:ribulose-phosphate 3-epimerase n=1 Tax=Buchnera aphidicola TaxID=9 RepID=UPI0031B7FEFF